MNLAEHIVDILLEAEEVSPEDVIRRSDIGVEYSDFLVSERADRWAGRYPTGNYHYYVSYKPIQVRGKPIYLGSVFAGHDYNRTGSTKHVHFSIDSVPTWYTTRTGLKRGVTGKTSPFKGGPKTVTHHGHRGIVAMDKPEYQTFTNLFDACKYLLSLLRQNARTQPNFDLPKSEHVVT